MDLPPSLHLNQLPILVMIHFSHLYASPLLEGSLRRLLSTFPLRWDRFDALLVLVLRKGRATFNSGRCFPLGPLRENRKPYTCQWSGGTSIYNLRPKAWAEKLGFSFGRVTTKQISRSIQQITVHSWDVHLRCRCSKWMPSGSAGKGREVCLTLLAAPPFPTDNVAANFPEQ